MEKPQLLFTQSDEKCLKDGKSIWDVKLVLWPLGRFSSYSKENSRVEFLSFPDLHELHVALQLLHVLVYNREHHLKLCKEFI